MRNNCELALGRSSWLSAGAGKVVRERRRGRSRVRSPFRERQYLEFCLRDRVTHAFFVCGFCCRAYVSPSDLALVNFEVNSYQPPVGKARFSAVPILDFHIHRKYLIARLQFCGRLNTSKKVAFIYTTIGGNRSCGGNANCAMAIATSTTCSIGNSTTQSLIWGAHAPRMSTAAS